MSHSEVMPSQRLTIKGATPRLDGWILAFGDPFDSGEDGAAEPEAVTERCADLSRRFGEAHWYGMSCGDDWTAWCVARDGEVVRYYEAFEPEQAVGPSHPAEEGYLLPHEDGFPEDAFHGVDPTDHDAFLARYQLVKQELNIPDTCNATLFAGRASVDPARLGPQTRVEGHGVLALTACGRVHGHPRGALRI